MSQIPKQIHYCWFGRNPLPESAKKCIASWRKFLPDYEIIEWNEDNFDVNIIPYTAQAYSVGKYAFVSDYARFKILYDFGGLYFDTDVEVIKPIDEIISTGTFLGFEINPHSETGRMAVNPGLGMGAVSGMPIYYSILDYYSRLNFFKEDNTLNLIDAVVNITTRELKKVGLQNLPGKQEVAGITVYPACYFNPLDDATGKLNITPETVSIHWFTKTWCDKNSELRTKMVRVLHRMIGTDTTAIIKRIFGIK